MRKRKQEILSQGHSVDDYDDEIDTDSDDDGSDSDSEDAAPAELLSNKRLNKQQKRETIAKPSPKRPALRKNTRSKAAAVAKNNTKSQGSIGKVKAPVAPSAQAKGRKEKDRSKAASSKSNDRVAEDRHTDDEDSRIVSDVPPPTNNKKKRGLKANSSEPQQDERNSIATDSRSSRSSASARTIDISGGDDYSHLLMNDADHQLPVPKRSRNKNAPLQETSAQQPIVQQPRSYNHNNDQKLEIPLNLEELIKNAIQGAINKKTEIDAKDNQQALGSLMEEVKALKKSVEESRAETAAAKEAAALATAALAQTSSHEAQNLHSTSIVPNVASQASQTFAPGSVLPSFQQFFPSTLPASLTTGSSYVLGAMIINQQNHAFAQQHLQLAHSSYMAGLIAENDRNQKK